jgi:hypothetical protein
MSWSSWHSGYASGGKRVDGDGGVAGAYCAAAAGSPPRVGTLSRGGGAAAGRPGDERPSSRPICAIAARIRSQRRRSESSTALGCAAIASVSDGDIKNSSALHRFESTAV